MLSVALIVFREVLEIALILGILSAATKGVPGRDLQIWKGLLLGVAGSILVAFFMDAISSLFNGWGHEVFSGIMLLSIACFIIWTVLWLQQHGYLLRKKLKEAGESIATGEKPLHTLWIVVAFAVLREGTEVVLFTHGVLASGKDFYRVMSGSYLGLGAGLLTGLLMYYGLLRIPLRLLFRVTSWLFIFLASGMISHGVGFLAKAGLIPFLIQPVWNTSVFLPENHFPGSVLQILVGYSERPLAIQVVLYLLSFMLLAFLLNRRSQNIDFQKK